jgi:predicted nucleic acid-binding protein
MMADEVLSQSEAWAVYDRWLEDPRVAFVEEPQTLEQRFRAMTRSRRAAPEGWADAYLAAFADAAQFTLVTFDRGFRGKVGALRLLEP